MHARLENDCYIPNRNSRIRPVSSFAPEIQRHGHDDDYWCRLSGDLFPRSKIEIVEWLTEVLWWQRLLHVEYRLFERRYPHYARSHSHRRCPSVDIRSSCWWGKNVLELGARGREPKNALQVLFPSMLAQQFVALESSRTNNPVLSVQLSKWTWREYWLCLRTDSWHFDAIVQSVDGDVGSHRQGWGWVWEISLLGLIIYRLSPGPTSTC